MIPACPSLIIMLLTRSISKVLTFRKCVFDVCVFVALVLCLG